MKEANMRVRATCAIAAIAVAALVFAGCGTLTGAAVGAGSGAAIGAATGYGAGKGALIGTGVGAAAGAVYDIIKHERAKNDGYDNQY
jgi:hypothetical protein